MGDSYATDLPRTVIDEEFLAPEKSQARYSKTKEFQELKAYMESRIEFFQQYLPNGQEVAKEKPSAEMVNNWIIANTLIAEFQNVLLRYERAKEAVESVRGPRT